MDRTSGQTALFFGFLTAAMTYASAQAAPAPAAPHPPASVQQTAGERLLAQTEQGRHGPLVRQDRRRVPKA